ncbi:MAG: oligosaccharide flippase family protein [Candidatus Eisenbacteria bacterium]|nr:oligosaccharide flippase family protein [Candidatus Eisenbacteria bacterium]
MAKLTTQAGGVSLGRGVAALAGLATAMVLSRWLSPDDYGTYRQIWLVFFTLAPIFELGIPPSVSFFVPQLPRENLKRYFVQNGLALLVSGSLVALALLTLAEPLARLFGNPALITALRAFALFPALTLPFHMTENALVALGRAGRAGLVSGTAALLQSAVILLAFFSGASLERVFFYVSLWALLRWLCVTAGLFYGLRGQSLRWDRRELGRQLWFALPMGAAAMVGLLSRQVDKLIVSANFPPERYAIYANGSYDIPLINVLTLSVTAVLVPALVRANAAGDTAEIRRLWHGAARRMAWLFFPAFCFLFVAARPLMVFLFSPAYAESAGPFRVLLFLLPLRILFHGGFLRALGRTRPIFYASAGSLLISIVLALLLVRVRPLGFLGPAMGSVAGAYGSVLVAIHVVSRHLGWRWRDYFPWRTLGGIMAVAIAAALPTAVLAWTLRGSSALLQLLLLGGAYASVYLILGQATGAARPREWIEAIGDLLRQR